MHTISSDDWALFQKAFEQEWQGRWSRFLFKHITQEQKAMLEKWILKKVSNGPISKLTLLEEAINTFGDHEWVKYAFSSWGSLLKSLCYQNDICFYPTGDSNVYVLREDVGMYQKLNLSADDALLEIYKRYLHSYGPASYHDFVHWSGTTISRLKQILNKKNTSISNPAVSAYNPPLINFLPKFDPYVLAHKDKFYIQDHYYQSVFKRAGNIEAIILKNGVVIGSWKQEKGLVKEYILFDDYEKYNLDNIIEEELIRMKLI